MYTTISLVSLALLLWATVPAAYGADALKPQATCPIMGGAIDETAFVDVLGQRVYLCCPGCADKVKAAPEKALATLGERGEYAESLQTTCPVMGDPIKKSLFVEYQGRRLYVCCRTCLSKVKKDPATWAAKVAEGVNP